MESLQVALKSTVWIIAKTQLAELRAVKPMAGGGNAMSTAKMLGRAVGVSLLTATALVAVQVLSSLILERRVVQDRRCLGDWKLLAGLKRA